MKWKDIITWFLLAVCIVCSVTASIKTGVVEGKQGIQGIQGEKGDKGEQGIQGEKGEQGIQGIQGIQGEKGDQGIQGIQGIQGEQGIQGIQGEQGVQGKKGDKGEKGEKGESLEIAGFVYQNFDGTADIYKVIYKNGTSSYIYIIRNKSQSFPSSTEWIDVYGKKYIAKRQIAEDTWEYKYKISKEVRINGEDSVISVVYILTEKDNYGYLDYFPQTDYCLIHGKLEGLSAIQGYCGFCDTKRQFTDNLSAIECVRKHLQNNNVTAVYEIFIE